MFKNVAAKFMVFAWDTTTGVAKTGDAANITAYVSKDYGTVTVLADTSATEMDSTNAKGCYLFDAAQGETNGDVLMVSAKSSTSNIAVIGAPAVIFTRPTTGWLAPTTAGRTLDVSAGGEAGVDWANVGSPTTSLALTGTTIATTQKVDVETIKTNPVVNAGTITFPTGATLASTTNITAGTITTATNVTTVNGLAANVITAASMNADASAEIADAVWDEDATGHQTQGTFGQAIGDPAADTNTIYGAVVTGAAGATVAADIIAVKAETASIQSDTNDIQSRLPAALTADGNIKADTLRIGGTLQTANDVGADVDAILVDTAEIGVAGAGLTAVPWNSAWDAEVQSEVDDALVARRLDELLNADSDIDGAAPPTVGSVFHELMTKTAGSFTYDQTTDSLEALRDNMGTAQTGDSFARLGAPVGASVSVDIAAVKTDAAAIKAKTDNLPSDPADASDIASSFTTVNSKLDTIDDFLDTEVAAIKTETDKIASIKTKTDSLTFTVANKLDGNVKSVNDVTVTGTGTSGDPWGP